MYRYEFTSIALKQLGKLPVNIQKRIIKKLDFYCRQKNSLRFADFLIDYRLGSYRFRVGDYRIVFDIESEVIVIFVVGHRREIYKKGR